MSYKEDDTSTTKTSSSSSSLNKKKHEDTLKRPMYKSDLQKACYPYVYFFLSTLHVENVKHHNRLRPRYKTIVSGRTKHNQKLYSCTITLPRTENNLWPDDITFTSSTEHSTVSGAEGYVFNLHTQITHTHTH